MKVIGKTTIHPIFFFSGKISGYITWIILLLEYLNLSVFRWHNIIYLQITSYLVLAIGLILTIISLINLGNSISLGVPDEKTVFKTNGLYKISRNPMYVGFNLLTISSIVYTGNPIIMLLGIYSIVIYHFIILGEEAFLEKRFGKVYIEYKMNTRRYILKK